MWYSGFDNPNHSQIGFANQLTIGVEQEGFLLNEFNLFQNYPNPFNPNTVISYQLPVISNVTLKVYDLLGREIVTLVNEEKPAGTYEVEFNSHSGLSGIRDLPSGIYFYQLKTGNYIETKKMLMIK
ncbi:MAG: T9SS C-terminal target domain-containing protein [Ignavibacteriae bacterium]|nr:T9SS C-terminal target domain-containing protein [Ignavibacteriota bacterium]